MKISIYTAFFALCISVALGEDLKLRTYTVSNVGQYVWSADTDLIESTISWDGTGAPPFDMKIICDKAITQARKSDPAASISGITFGRMTNWPQLQRLEDKWFITVTMRGKLDLPQMVFLANGEMIEPQIQKIASIQSKDDDNRQKAEIFKKKLTDSLMSGAPKIDNIDKHIAEIHRENHMDMPGATNATQKLTLAIAEELKALRRQLDEQQKHIDELRKK